MKILWIVFAILLLAGPAAAADERPGSRSVAPPSSEQLEKELQALSWQQFRSVVRSIPKLKAEVDAYGPAGWQYIQTRYTTYRWRKKLDKLSGDQKKELAGLIVAARAGRLPPR